MNLINLNFNEHIDDIIDAISEVMDPEFKPYISERIKKRYEIFYVKDIELKSYLQKLKEYKQMEFCKKFLLEIGEEIDETLTEEEKTKAILNQINKYLFNYKF